MSGMFKFCSGLKDLNCLKNLDIHNVRDIDMMFMDYENLESLEGVEFWDTKNIKTLKDTFRGCKKLKNINALKNWNTTNFSSLSFTFAECNELDSIEALGSWDVTNVKTVYFIFGDLFKNSSKLVSLKGIKKWNLNPSVRSASPMFIPYNIMKDYPNWYNEISFKDFVEYRFPEKLSDNHYENIKIHRVLQELEIMDEKDYKKPISIELVKTNLLQKYKITEEEIDRSIDLLIKMGEYEEKEKGYLINIVRGGHDLHSMFNPIMY